MDEKKNLKQIECQVKEIRDKLWKVEKSLDLSTDELYLYRLVRSLEAKHIELEERLNVIETSLNIGDFSNG